MNAITRKWLRLAALLVLVGTLGVWLATGAHTGWTQTRVVVMQEDPITGIEYPEHHDRFVAGVEVLAVGVALSVLLGGVTFLGRKRVS